MSNTTPATQAPIGTVTSTGWKGCPYGPARTVMGCLACGSRPVWLVSSMGALLKMFQVGTAPSGVVREAPADLFCQYPLVLELNKRIERGTSSTHRKPLRRTPGVTPARQVTMGPFIHSGGRLNAVNDLDSALAALEEIVEQGEGTARGEVW